MYTSVPPTSLNTLGNYLPSGRRRCLDDSSQAVHTAPLRPLSRAQHCAHDPIVTSSFMMPPTSSRNSAANFVSHHIHVSCTAVCFLSATPSSTSIQIPAVRSVHYHQHYQETYKHVVQHTAYPSSTYSVHRGCSTELLNAATRGTKAELIPPGRQRLRLHRSLLQPFQVDGKKRLENVQLSSEMRMLLVN